MCDDDETILPVITAEAWEEVGVDHFVFGETPVEETLPAMLWVPLWLEA